LRLMLELRKTRKALPDQRGKGGNFFEVVPVWQKVMEHVQKIYAITEVLPGKEDYGVTSQIRRSAGAVLGGIAEGFGRKHAKGGEKFNYAFQGASAEPKRHLINGERVGYLRNLIARS